MARVARWRRVADRQERDDGFGRPEFDVLRFDRQHAVEMQPALNANVSAGAAALRFFPLEAIEDGSKAALLREVGNILDPCDCVLKMGGDDFEVLGIFSRQHQAARVHVETRSMFAPTRLSFSSNRSKP